MALECSSGKEKTLLRQLLERAGAEDEDWLRSCFSLPSGTAALEIAGVSAENEDSSVTHSERHRHGVEWVPKIAEVPRLADLNSMRQKPTVSKGGTNDAGLGKRRHIQHSSYSPPPNRAASQRSAGIFSSRGKCYTASLYVMTGKTSGKKQQLASGSIGRASNRLARIDVDADSPRMSTARSLPLSKGNIHEIVHLINLYLWY